MMASIRASSACQRCFTHFRPLLTAPRPIRPAAAAAGSLRCQSTVSAAGPKGGVSPPLDLSGPPPYRVPREARPGVLEGQQQHHQQRVLLRHDNLFHPWESSPAAAIRERAARIKRTAYCPHSEHGHAAMQQQQQQPQHVAFTCPDCGIPTHCSADHWLADYEKHLAVCDALREANEDEHDLHSARFFPEFEYPGQQMEEQLVNMTNWDTFLYTRNFAAVDADRQLRQLTKLITYPTTVASFLHELSPYSLRHRLTPEGLRSVSGIPPSPSPSSYLLPSPGLIGAKPSDTRCTRWRRVAVQTSRACTRHRRRCGCSFWARAPSRRCRAKCGTSWRTSSRAPRSTWCLWAPRP